MPSPIATEARCCRSIFSLAGIRTAVIEPANQVGMSEKNKMHFSELDGIRGVLCLTVLLYHWGLNGLVEGLTSGYIANGRWELAVDFFFVLSGFVLCHSTGKKAEISIWDFLLKRCVRLLPVSIICLGIALLAKPSFLEAPLEVIANLLLIQVFLGYPSFNGASWSACLELWVPPVFIYPSRVRHRNAVLLRAALAAFLCLQAMVLCGLLFSSGYQQPVARSFFGLMSGFALYLLCEGLKFPFSSRRLNNVLAYALISGILAIMCLSGECGLLVCLFPFLTACTILVCSTSKTALSGRIFQYFGKVSYSIYMVHMPMILLTVSLVGSAAMEGNAMRKGVAILITIGVADLIHRFIEVPAMSVFRRQGARGAAGNGGAR